MTNEAGFEERIRQIGERVDQLELVADPALRAASKELVRLLMELHGTAIERILEMTYESGDAGARLINEFGRDPLVSSLLVLYGLHPDDLQTRVERKLAEIRSRLYKMGAEVKAVEVTGDDVRVRMSMVGHSCGSTGMTVKAAVEQAVYDAAPDLGSLEIEGLGEEVRPGFVAIDALLGATTTSQGLMPRQTRESSEGLD